VRGVNGAIQPETVGEVTRRRKLGVALQGMAVWHMAFCAFLVILTLAILALAILASPEGDQESGDWAAMMVLAGFVLAAGACLGALVLGGMSCVLLGKVFLRPRWSLLVVPGLVGTLVAGIPAGLGWPPSEIVGAFVAYHLVARRFGRQGAGSV